MANHAVILPVERRRARLGDRAVTSVTINVDGQIDLTDLTGPGDLPKHARGDSERVRTSRLADVMIVMERERAALEETLRSGLTERVLPDGIAHLARLPALCRQEQPP